MLLALVARVIDFFALIPYLPVENRFFHRLVGRDLVVYLFINKFNRFNSVQGMGVIFINHFKYLFHHASFYYYIYNSHCAFDTCCIDKGYSKAF